MATKDDFPLDDPLPLFLSNHAEEPEQQPGIGKAWDRAVLVVTAAAIVFAALFVGNPLAIFANSTASLVATSALQDGTTQSMPVIQSTADAQAPTAREVPTGDEIAAAFKTAYQSQTTEALSRTARTRCPSTGRAKCPSTGPVRAKAPTHPACA